LYTTESLTVYPNKGHRWNRLIGAKKPENIYILIII
jgi:hypothetical protein